VKWATRSWRPTPKSRPSPPSCKPAAVIPGPDRPGPAPGATCQGTATSTRGRHQQAHARRHTALAAAPAYLPAPTPMDCPREASQAEPVAGGGIREWVIYVPGHDSPACRLPARNRRYGVLPDPGWEGRHVRTVISRSERARLTLRFLAPLLGPGLPGLGRSGRCHLPDVRAGLAW